MATLAVANAGYIDAPGHLAYSGGVNAGYHHGYDVAPIAKVASYSAAPSVSHVYSSVAAPVHHKTLEYAAPVHHKTIEYATAPVHQSYEYATPVHHKTIEYAAPVHKTIEYPAVHKTIEYAAPVHNLHYSTEKHISSVPSHTLAYAVAPAKTVSYTPAVYESHHHAQPTYGHTHESVERSHDGTVSHYGKTISTPHSHVQKYDTRITNDQHHYKVAAAVPVVHQYAHHDVPSVHHYAHSAPTAYVAPAVQHQYTAAHHVATPVHHHYAAAPQYAHAAPVVAHKTVSYSPADVVAHATFESADAHYSW